MSDSITIFHKRYKKHGIWKRAFKVWLFIILKGGLTLVVVLLFNKGDSEHSPLVSLLVPMAVSAPVIPMLAGLYIYLRRKRRTRRETLLFLFIGMVLFNILVLLLFFLLGEDPLSKQIQFIFPYTLASLFGTVLVNWDWLFRKPLKLMIKEAWQKLLGKKTLGNSQQALEGKGKRDK